MGKYLYIPPSEIFKLSYDLCKKIKESGFNPDFLLGISRGGLCVTRILSDYFDIRDVRIVRVIYYKGIKKTKTKPKLAQDLDFKSLKKKRFLLIDDVADTGGSLDYIVNLLRKREIKNFKIATLHHKPWSKFKPDFFVGETDKWIIYPWEVGENIRLIMKKRMRRKEKMKELKETGIPKELIKIYKK
jgi:hypoxanthine phosphoribosyltransferase